MGGDSATSTVQGPVHLVVLQHGLWGNTTCVSNLEHYLRQQLRPQDAAVAGEGSKHGPAADARQQMHEEVQILNSDVNRKALTYDGIDVCGARVVKMVLDCIQLLQSNGRQVNKLSFVGYSLGGLILRYAVGKLYVLGLFEEVECANFITIATPHLGSWRSPTSFWARFFNSHVAVVGSRTGRQLMLADADYSVPWLTHQQQLHEQHTHQQSQPHSQAHKQQPTQQQQQQPQAEMPPGVSPGQAVPLLLLMAHPCGPFHRALKGFRTRMVAANTLYDAMVPYCTAALCMSNPYEERRAVSINAERYPSVVRPAGEGEVVPELTYKGRTKRLFLFALFSPLAPLLYIWTVTYGLLHHRSARKKALEGSWLQQHPQAAPAAAIDAITGLGSSTLTRSSSNSSKQTPLLLGAAGTRTSATLAGDADAAGVSEETGLTDGLISTAVEELGEGEDHGVGEDQGGYSGAGTGTGHSSLEQAMQQVAAGTADGGVSPAAPAAVTAAAAAVEGSSAAGLSRRRSDSLAAAVAHHQREDELGRLSRQFVNSSSSSSRRREKDKESIRASLKGGADGAGDGGAVGGDAAEAAAMASPATAAAAASPVAAGGKARVTVDRDGIVEAPSLLHVQQEWMARQLFDNMPPCHVPDNTQPAEATCSVATFTQSSKGNANAAAGTAAGSSSGSSGSNAAGRARQKGGWTQEQGQGVQKQGAAGSIGGGSSSAGGWHRVDVCTRHWHAHAAIIIRDYRFEGQSRDMFQYLVDHMSL